MDDDSKKEPVDPGFWRRPLPKWSQWLLIGIAAVILIAAVAVTLSLGVNLF